MTPAEPKKRKPKAHHGDGGYTWVPSRQAFVVRVTVTDPVTGKKSRPAQYVKTEAEAKALKRQMAADAQRGAHAAAAPRTVAAILDDWLAVTGPSVRPLTRGTYRSVVTLHLAPALGAHRADRLTARHVQAWLTQHTQRVAPVTAARHLGVLRTALEWALRAGYVERNVAKLVSAPTPERVERPALTPEQARQLLAAVAGGWEEALIALALGLSLRRGEALGLRWRDVDFKAGALTVRSQALPLGTGAVEPDQPTKTAASRRRLPLPERVRAALLAQRDRQRLACQAEGVAWSEDHFVCEEVGVRPRGVASVANVMRRALAAAGLPPMRYHDLRGVCASLLLADGVDVRSVMHILGHSDPSLTLAVYARVNPEQMQRAAESMGRTLGG